MPDKAYDAIDAEMTCEEWLQMLKQDDNPAELHVIAQHMQESYEGMGSPYPLTREIWLHLAAVVAGY